MKRFILPLMLIIGLVGVFGGIDANAKLTKGGLKERREIKKEAIKSIDVKASKESQKEAKKLEKDGWKAMPGSLPLTAQLDRQQLINLDRDEETDDLIYVTGMGLADSDRLQGAYLAASDAARRDLMSKISAKVASLIKSEAGNNVSSTQATSLNKVLASTKTLLDGKITNTENVLSLYKQNGKNSYTVQIIIAYKLDQALKAAKEAMQQELEQKGDELSKELDSIIKW